MEALPHVPPDLRARAALFSALGSWSSSGAASRPDKTTISRWFSEKKKHVFFIFILVYPRVYYCFFFKKYYLFILCSWRFIVLLGLLLFFLNVFSYFLIVFMVIYHGIPTNNRIFGCVWHVVYYIPFGNNTPIKLGNPPINWGCGFFMLWWDILQRKLDMVQDMIW